jgi:pimeloyl-ACP methyl ester carboxylesterase
MPTMPRVVFIPGLACDAHLWAAQAASLSRAGWPVAHSDVATREPTLPRMAQALLAGHPGRLVLAGASMGAMVALHAALQAPDRVSALVLVGASARADDTDLRRLRADAIAHFEQGDVEPFLRANALLVLHPSADDRRRPGRPRRRTTCTALCPGVTAHCGWSNRSRKGAWGVVRLRKRRAARQAASAWR